MINRRSPSAFRKGAPVVYISANTSRTLYWGKRSGAHRVLLAHADASTGFLVQESEVGNTLFPAPVDNCYDSRHATCWDLVASRTVRVRLFALKVEPLKWIGAIVAKYGEHERNEALCVTSPGHHSMSDVVANLLATVADDLRQYAAKSSRARATATSVFLAFEEFMAEEFELSVLRPEWMS